MEEATLLGDRGLWLSVTTGDSNGTCRGQTDILHGLGSRMYDVSIETLERRAGKLLGRRPKRSPAWLMAIYLTVHFSG